MRKVLTAAVAMGAVVFGACSVDTSEDAQYDAERVCKEQFIAKRLKAPSTADYDLTVSGGPDTYVVSGTVDSENSFGAKLRSNVTCEVTIVGDQWRLDSLTGLN